MAANVRCDGKRSELDGAVIFDACGWEGRRFAAGPALREARYFGDPQAQKIEDRMVTRPPCPLCGGKVELIESTTGGDSGGNERSC